MNSTKFEANDAQKGRLTRQGTNTIGELSSRLQAMAYYIHLHSRDHEPGRHRID